MNKRKLETAGEIVSSMTDAEAEALKVLLQQMPPAVKDAGAALLERLQAAYQAYSQPHRRVIKVWARIQLIGGLVTRVNLFIRRFQLLTSKALRRQLTLWLSVMIRFRRSISFY